MKNINTFEEFSWNEVAEKQVKINELERELFYDIITDLIKSNNVEKMYEFVNYMKGKVWLSLNQFIHQQIYKIYKMKDEDVKASDINIDYNDLDKRIELFKEKSKEF